MTTLIQYPAGKAGNYTVPTGVTSIVNSAFAQSTSLTNIVIANGVSSIGTLAFSGCANLAGVYFEGNAASLGLSFGGVFNGANHVTVYYLPGTVGWGATCGGRPTAQWLLPNPLILDSSPSFGIRTNRFGFMVSWATNLSIVVEASTNPASPVWSPLKTNTLSKGSFYFSDPEWTNHPARFYRLRWP